MAKPAPESWKSSALNEDSALRIRIGLAGLAAPADVNLTGKWTGSFAAEGQQAEQGGILMHSKQAGRVVSGTIGPSEEQQLEIRCATPLSRSPVALPLPLVYM